MYGIVYLALNKANNKAYVGQTIQSLAKRRAGHYVRAKKNKRNSYFYNALRKYKRSDWKWSIIVRCDSQEELDKEEIAHIQKYDDDGLGYNMTLGGGRSIGYEHTEEVRRNMSASHKGIKLSDEHRKAISEAMKGRILTKEHRKNISEFRQGMVFNENHCKNMSKGRIGKYMGAEHPNAKAVLCIETDRVYDTLTEAAKEVGISIGWLSEAMIGKRKAGGYNWIFV